MRAFVSSATVIAIGIGCGFFALPATAGQPIAVDAKDQPIVDAFCAHARTEARKLDVDKLRKQKMPEMFCWIELKYLGLPLTAYELTGDPTYLEDFIAGFEQMRQVLSTDEAGYLGWYGIAIKDNADPAKPETRIDDIQTSFRATAVVGKFLELIQQEKTLAAKHAKLCAEYLDLVENHLVAKWHARGAYVDLGEGGAVYRINSKYKPQRAGITLPYEKVSIMVDGLLNLYGATGKPVYLRRAIKVGTRLKRCMILTDGRYQWHYWDPAGAWDATIDPAKWNHWIGPEPRSEWHAVTVGIATRLYHLGVVFDKTDIDRLVKTQTEVSWNGDLANPKFLCTNAKPTQGKQMMVAPSLAPFNEQVATLLFTGPRFDWRLAKKGSAWHGGVRAEAWLRAKCIEMPKAVDGKPGYLAKTKAFRADPEQKKFLDSLAFKVTEGSYKTPWTPTQLQPLPQLPKAK